MKKYNKYKDSGIEWLGTIPENWEVKKLRHIFTFSKGLSITKENLQKNGIPCVSYGEIHSKYGFEVNPDRDKLSCVSSDYIANNEKSIISRGDFVFADTSEDIEGSGNFTHLHSDCKTFAGYHTIIARLKTSDNYRFVAYLMDSIIFRQQIRQQVKGVKVFSITNKILKDAFLWSPLLSEQTAIASFLDHKTAQIDALIEKKEFLIEKLKLQRQAIINEVVTKGLNPEAPMKDSGIVWLGEIPEHWEEAKVKHIACINGRIGFKGYTKDDLVNEGEGALTLGAKHIDKDNNLDLSSPEYIAWEKYYESPEIMVKVDDVIFTQRGSLGKVCHINKPIGEATINPSMVILNNILIHPRFLYFWLCSNRIQSEVNLLQANTAVPMISQFQLENFPIVFPDKIEQIEIVRYLDETLTKFKTLISNSNDSIDKLKLYRQTLISEAVTGKIDVRDWNDTDN